MVRSRPRSRRIEHFHVRFMSVGATITLHQAAGVLRASVPPRKSMKGKAWMDVVREDPRISSRAPPHATPPRAFLTFLIFSLFFLAILLFVGSSCGDGMLVQQRSWPGSSHSFYAREKRTPRQHFHSAGRTTLRVYRFREHNYGAVKITFVLYSERRRVVPSPRSFRCDVNSTSVCGTAHRRDLPNLDLLSERVVDARTARQLT